MKEKKDKPLEVGTEGVVSETLVLDMIGVGVCLISRFTGDGMIAGGFGVEVVGEGGRRRGAYCFLDGI